MGFHFLDRDFASLFAFLLDISKTSSWDCITLCGASLEIINWWV